MAKKKAVAVVAPVVEKATEQYKMNARFTLYGSKAATDEFAKLIRKGEGANYLQIGLLIGLPAFVEEGKPIDHPRSKERWSILWRNTVQEEVALTHYSVVQDTDGKVRVNLAFDMQAEILKNSRLSDENVEFRFLQELVFYFGDLDVGAGWKLTDASSGEVIYGMAKKQGLIQAQTKDHELVRELFEAQAKLLEGAVYA